MQNLIFIGRITHDLELRYSEKNKPYLVLPIAINSGNDNTTYIKFLCYEKAAETHYKYLSKGDLILVKASIKNKVEEYQGHKNYTYSFYANQVNYLSTKKTMAKSEELIQETAQQTDKKEETDPFKDFGEEIQLSDEDLPF